MSGEEARVNRLDFQKTRVTVQKDKNGFVVLEARPTGVGVLKYPDGKGGFIRELRRETEVFKPESMATMALKPFTLMHRGRHLDSKTAKRFMHGMTGENIRQDGDFIACKISIVDEKAIEGIEDGSMVELSPGYSCKIDKTPGEWRGERYDQEQINIVYNNVSGVDKARKSGASFRFDSEDGELLISGFEFEEKETMADQKRIKLPSVDAGENLRFDSIHVDETPETMELVSRFDKAILVVGEIQTKLSETQGRLDSVTEELKTEKESKNDLIPADRLDSLVSENEKVLRLLKAKGVEYPKEGTYEEKIHKGKVLLLGDNEEIDHKRLDSDASYLDGVWGHFAGDVEAKEAALMAKQNLEKNKNHNRNDSNNSDNGKDASEGV